MKVMKKIAFTLLSVLLCLLASFSLFACGEEEGSGSGNGGTGGTGGGGTPTPPPVTITVGEINGGGLYFYNGEEHKPEPSVTKDGTALVKGTDFDYVYANNVNAGTGSVTIDFKGEYDSETDVTRTFIIEPQNVTPIVEIANGTYTYNGQAHTPTVTVKADEEELGTADYEVAYADNVNAGTGSVTVTLKGNYTGTKTEEFAIARAKIEKPEGDDTVFTYTGTEQTYELAENVGYTISGNLTATNAGTETITVTLNDNYEWTEGNRDNETYSFVINPYVLSAADIIVSEHEGLIYNGQKKVPNANALTSIANDVTITNEGGTNAGTYHIIIEPKAGNTNVTGSASISYTIAPKEASLNVSAISNQTYNGNELRPAIVVMDGSHELVLDTDYTVAYTNNTNAGVATVTITLINNYTGSTSSNFTINKANPVVSDVVLEATYGDVLGQVTLPTVSGGNLAWVDAESTSVGDAGEKIFKANFTPTDSDNYNSIQVDVTVEVQKANPVLNLTCTEATWSNVSGGIAVQSAWVEGSTDGTEIAWVGGANPIVAGTYKVVLTYAESTNYNASSQEFDFVIKPDSTLAAAYSWSEYAGNNPSAVAYDPLINKNYVWSGSNDFNGNYNVANVNYTENFNTANEKGFDYKAILTEDGLYFVATARHDVIRTGNAEWAQNTNIESKIYNANGSGTAFHMSINSVDGLTVTDADVHGMVSSYSIMITEADASKNYKYVTEFKGLIPQAYLIANNFINASGNAMIHFGFCNGSDSRIVVDISNVAWDSATNTETFSEGTYNYKTITSNAVDTNVAGTVILTNNEGQWFADGRKINLTIVSRTANSDGTHSFYLDYIDDNDVFYSLGAHTLAKPWIVYPKEYDVYGGGAKAVHVGTNGMLWSYKATEAVIDGNADDDMWVNYKGGAITITEQRSDLLASAGAGANFEGRNVTYKLVEGETGIYVYAVARTNKFVDYMPADNDNIFNTEFRLNFYLTPDNDAWNNAVTPEISTTDAGAYTVLGDVIIRSSGDLAGNVEYCMTSSKAQDDAYYTTILEAYIDFGYFGGKYSGPTSGYNLRVNATFGSANEYAALPGSASLKNHWFNTLSNNADWSNINAGEANGKYQKLPGYYYLVKGVGVMGKKRANDYAIDGDLSDWADYQGVTQTFVDRLNANKTVSNRAIRTVDGIYLASEAITQNYYLYGGNSQSGTQLFIKATVNGADYNYGYIRNGWWSRNGQNSADVTQYNEVATKVTPLGNGYYKVVFEVFISNASWQARVGSLPNETTPLVALVFYANSDKGTDNFAYPTEYKDLGNADNGRDWCASNQSGSPTLDVAVNKDGKMYVTTNGFSLTDPLSEQA